MKNFTSIQTWLASNPSKEEQLRILVIINRKQLSENRNGYYKAEQEFNRLNSYVKTTQKLGLELPKDLEIKVSKMEIELQKTFKSLWPDGKKAKVAKPKTDKVEPKADPKLDIKIEEEIQSAE